MDLAATFLGRVRAQARRYGKPLVEGLARRQDADDRDAVRSGLGAWRMAYDGRYSLHGFLLKPPAGPLRSISDDPLENIAAMGGRHASG
jgi:hypothetical protein